MQGQTVEFQDISIEYIIFRFILGKMNDKLGELYHTCM